MCYIALVSDIAVFVLKRDVKLNQSVTGTAGVKKSLLGLDSWIAAAEEVSLQTASEGGERRCRRDVLWQTVPNTGCSDWKSTGYMETQVSPKIGGHMPPSFWPMSVVAKWVDGSRCHLVWR